MLVLNQVQQGLRVWVYRLACTTVKASFTRMLIIIFQQTADKFIPPTPQRKPSCYLPRRKAGQNPGSCPLTPFLALLPKILLAMEILSGD